MRHRTSGLPPRVRLRPPPRLRGVAVLYGEMRMRIEQAISPVISKDASILCLVGRGGIIVRISDTVMQDALRAGDASACLPVLRALDEAMALDGIDIIVIERQVPDHVSDAVGAGWERFWREGRSKVGSESIPEVVSDALFQRIKALHATLRRWPASEQSIRAHVDRLVARALASLS